MKHQAVILYGGKKVITMALIAHCELTISQSDIGRMIINQVMISDSNTPLKSLIIPH